MNTKSVRFRLTLWYSLAFFVTTAAVFAIFYLVTREVLFRQTDNTLTAHGDKILEVLSRQDTGMHTMLEKQAFIRDFSEIPGMIVVILDSSKNVINSSVMISSGNPFLSQLSAYSQNSIKPVFANDIVSGSQMRFWAMAVRDSQGKFTGTVLVAHPIDVINNSLNSLFYILAAVLLISVLPAVLGGYILARRALEPINNMTEELKRISSESLNKRVPNPKTGDELEELAVTFNGLLDRLNLAFKRERQFIGDVAHELKTPLTTLQSSLEITLSKDRGVKEYQQGYAEALVDVKKLSSTLRNILDLAWSEAGNTVAYGEKFNFSEEMRELYDMAVKMATAKKITVAGKIAEGIYVCGKKDKLGRTVLNLIDNAVKYTPANGRVDINLSKKGSKAVVEVKDSGPGIRREDLSRIFDRFYRGSKGSQILGSGLGLAIAKATVLAHRGEIRVKSRVGHGATFIIILPRSSS